MRGSQQFLLELGGGYKKLPATRTRCEVNRRRSIVVTKRRPEADDMARKSGRGGVWCLHDSFSPFTNCLRAR